MRRALRITLGSLLGIVLIALMLVAVAWFAARPARPGPFYTAALRSTTTPGTLLRAEPFTRDVPAGVHAWRILYVTTLSDGKPTLASAIVAASAKPHAGARHVLAWAHGTVGVVSGCAPSLLPHPFAGIPALPRVLSEGWVLVATDYAGLGTAGPQPYLVGEAEGRSVLDSIRAASELSGTGATGSVVVWGHSQGGHAALWSGILAPTYAPDIHLAGVAALAPATDLRALLDAAQSTPVGKILASYILLGESATYPDVHFGHWLRPFARPLMHDMANRCLVGKAALFSAAEAMLVRGSPFAMPPDSGALGKHLAQNTPTAPIAAPLLIAQGETDELVLPRIQDQYVEARCRAGQVIDYRLYPKRDHLSLVFDDARLDADLLAWTHARFAGQPAPARCRVTHE